MKDDLNYGQENISSILPVNNKNTVKPHKIINKIPNDL
jgi:hypothetical protein